MTQARIVRFIRRIALTLESEIDCGECAHLSAGYVEAVLSGQDGVDRWMPVKAHLMQCRICEEVFHGLYQVAIVDQEGEWPPVSFLLARLSGPEVGDGLIA